MNRNYQTKQGGDDCALTRRTERQHLETNSAQLTVQTFSRNAFKIYASRLPCCAVAFTMRSPKQPLATGRGSHAHPFQLRMITSASVPKVSNKLVRFLRKLLKPQSRRRLQRLSVVYGGDDTLAALMMMLMKISRHRPVNRDRSSENEPSLNSGFSTCRSCKSMTTQPGIESVFL